MIEMIGYLGLTLNLISMTMKNIYYLRVLSLLANIIYIFYGMLIIAYPLIIGCSIAVVIHSFKLYRLFKSSSVTGR